MKSVKIIVAAHKSVKVSEDPLYLPIFVGASGKEDIGFQRDDVGDNVSELNPYFCELTGLYWAVHHLDCDYIGLCHYRRYFKGAGKGSNKLDHVLTLEEADRLLNDYDVILPKKRHYYIESIYDHYRNTMYVEPLDICGEIIQEMYPEYYPEFEKLHQRRSAHMFNMLVMRKDILDGYCEWLFSILFELMKRVDVSQYDSFHARFPGRISERLLDVYINTNHIQYTEVPVIDTGNTNWFRKITGFIKSTIFKTKYDSSF